MAQLVTGSLFAENFWTAMLLGSAMAVWKYKETGQGAYLVLAAHHRRNGDGLEVRGGGLCRGAGLFRRGSGPAPAARQRSSGLALACMLVFAAPPYVTAFVKTGNPVYPFANALFRSPFYDTSVSLSDARFRAAPGWATLYDATFHSSRYLEGQNGALGFHYLLLLPLGVLLVGRRWPYAGWVAGATAAVGLAATSAHQANLRYAYAAFPLLMVFAAAALSRLRALDLALYRAVLCASLAALGLNLYFLPSSGWWHKGFRLGRMEGARRGGAVPDGLRARAEDSSSISTGSTRVRPWLSSRAARSQNCAASPTPTTGTSDSFVRRLRAAGSAEDCRNLMQELGIRYFVAPSPGSGLTVSESAG